MGLRLYQQQKHVLFTGFSCFREYEWLHVRARKISDNTSPKEKRSCYLPQLFKNVKKHVLNDVVGCFHSEIRSQRRL